MTNTELAAAIATLRDPRTIRERANHVLTAALDGRSTHFVVDLDQLAPTGQRVAQVTRERYPNRVVPIHSRMAHFAAGGIPRDQALRKQLASHPPLEQARALTALVITSVLLDAGSGPAWRYQDPLEPRSPALGRSEGLAVASLRWLASGALNRNRHPYAVDGSTLAQLGLAELQSAFQVHAENPLVGLEGRLALLQRLGQTLQQRPEVFGPDAQLGALADHFIGLAHDRRIPGPQVLQVLLDTLHPIWPSRPSPLGVSLGDVWPHPAAGGVGPSAGLMPFHKLSQWLTLSLVEPLASAALQVTDLSSLTGLAEYRNGGLLIDSGVLRLKDPAAQEVAHPPDSELIVEWRALTIALLDRLAPHVRAALGITDPTALPLPAILEGGTWAAGRQIARELRPADGAPPLQLASDGTVF